MCETPCTILVFPLCVCRFLDWPTAVTSHIWGGQEKILIALVSLVYLAPQELLESQVMWL